MEVKEYLSNAEDNMQLAVDYLEDTLSHIRAGKASARLLDGIRVDYYGSRRLLFQMWRMSVFRTRGPLPSRLGRNRCSRR